MRETTPPAPAPPTVIPAGATLAGDVDAPGDAQIAGRITGTLRVAGRLVLDARGRVDGAISTAHAALHGRAGADVTVAGLTELFPGAAVGGVLTTAGLTARDGARFEGQLVLGPPTPAGSADDLDAEPVSEPLSPPASDSAPDSAPAAVSPPLPMPFAAVPGVAHAGLRRRVPAG